MNSISPVALKNRVKVWRESSLANAELLRAEYRAHSFPPHMHEEFAIGFIERGAQAVLQQRKDRFVMPEGKICVINPGHLHEGRGATELGWDYRMIYISPQDLNAALIGSPGTTGTAGSLESRMIFFADSVIDDPDTLRLLRIAHLCSESTDTSRLEKSSRLTAALHQLVNRHAIARREPLVQPAMSAAVKRAREYIDANVTLNPSLEEIASAAALSPFHLLREFRKAVGMAPHAYLIQRRVEQAKHLLLKGRSLRTVAIEIGYADQAHLSREFRRFYGTPPGAVHS
ncbi:AraC family transcriptional regulator [Burkholderia sp. L27(2015)]|uniref:AraC family transcriptional regulator n=1 Tax=Burkholderia sp. L27(2015) TaxID=1641858 RepID=UPI00131D77DA|nr:AraC family transcriptional regulator [Burkholderia sp. L27(2015)]